MNNISYSIANAFLYGMVCSELERELGHNISNKQIEEVRRYMLFPCRRPGAVGGELVTSETLRHIIWNRDY